VTDSYNHIPTLKALYPLNLPTVTLIIMKLIGIKRRYSMEKSDLLLYIGWGVAIVFLGLALALGLSGNVDWVQAFLLWILLVGFLLLGLGMAKTRVAPKGSMLLGGTGGLLVVLATGFLSSTFGLFDISYGIAIIIVALGLGIVIAGLAKYREGSTSKDESDR
jgi:peptidoglycan/LPS O-acetylase OafA/YrhL